MATPLTGRRAGLVMTLLLTCTGISRGAGGDQPQFTYRSKVAEVRINFSVVDQNNHGVATLQASDFAVVDKGFIVRNFQSFTRSDWTKLEIGILVDASESVRPRFHQEIADVVELVSQSGGVPEENLSIFSFHDSRPALVCAGDCRTGHGADRLPPAGAGGLTPLFDTVVFASDFLSRHADSGTEKVLMVLSDGDDTISRNGLADAVAAALTGAVQIYSIGQSGSASSARGSAALESLAHATGGRHIGPPQAAPDALNAILEGFRATYAVTYRLPSHAPGFHTIRILPTHNLNLQFCSRGGYYYPNRAR